MGNEDEQPDLNAEDAMDELTEKAVENLIKNHTPVQLARWVVGALSGEEVWKVSEGAKLSELPKKAEADEQIDF